MIYRSSLRRLAHLLAVIARHTLAHAVALAVRHRPWLARRLRVRPLSGPERLRAAVEEMGGTFIKFGQMLALQPDILPLEYCNALFNLLDRVAPFPFAHVERTFREEFGRTPQEIFDSIETEPIATASIGQVHVAYLGGRKVAVKVQRPNVEADFTGDIRLMTATIGLVRRLRLKMFYWMIEPTSEFVAWTGEELDYRREARYMEQHRRNVRGNPHERVPEMFSDYVSRRTLVVEFIEGVSVLDYLRAAEAGSVPLPERLRATGFDAERFVYNILENFIGDAYRFGMFHADLHPANLMILPGNVVGYIDFGITGMLSNYSRQNIVSLTMSLGRGDFEGMCAAFFRISTVSAESDVAGFRRGMQEMNEGWYETQGNTRRLSKNATLVMLDMLKLSRKTSIYPERDVVKYIRSAIAIDGLITRLTPDFNLGQQLELICHDHLRRHARQAIFNYGTFAGWASSGGQLMESGFLRANGFLERMTAGRMEARAEISDVDAPESGRRAIRLASVVFVVSLLITFGGEQLRFGINMFTAEVMLVVSAALMLTRTAHRLTRGA
jgi:ubiquinone biosynthesis protein